MRALEAFSYPPILLPPTQLQLIVGATTPAEIAANNVNILRFAEQVRRSFDETQRQFGDFVRQISQDLFLLALSINNIDFIQLTAELKRTVWGTRTVVEIEDPFTPVTPDVWETVPNPDTTSGALLENVSVLTMGFLPVVEIWHLAHVRPPDQVTVGTGETIEVRLAAEDGGVELTQIGPVVTLRGPPFDPGTGDATLPPSLWPIFQEARFQWQVVSSTPRKVFLQIRVSETAGASYNRGYLLVTLKDPDVVRPNLPAAT